MKPTIPRVLCVIGAWLVLTACASTPPQTSPPPREDQHHQDLLDESAPLANAADASSDAEATALTDADAGQVAAPEAPLEGKNFLAEIRAVYRVAACGDADASWIPPGIDAKDVDAHCTLLRASYEEYRREWLAVAMPFIEKLRPKSLPENVIYPFGGGDLMGALATFPDGVTYTTISLETAGDVSGIMRADRAKLVRELTTLRSHLGKLFLKAHSRTDNLEIDSKGAVPGEAAFTMAALAIHGYEPIALRYFSIEKDGALHYFTGDEMAKGDRKTIFTNAETRFRKKGGGETKILRHVAFDLSDGNLKKDPSLLRYLDRESQLNAGKVSEMTKAASHLLWDDGNFSVIRDWLATHTDFMISDTTGFPPRIAAKYGFVQDVYGIYEGPEPFGTPNARDAADFKSLFQGHAAISFRYGYPDTHSHGHIVVTKKR